MHLEGVAPHDRSPIIADGERQEVVLGGPAATRPLTQVAMRTRHPAIVPRTRADEAQLSKRFVAPSPSWNSSQRRQMSAFVTGPSPDRA